MFKSVSIESPADLTSHDRLSVCLIPCVGTVAGSQYQSGSKCLLSLLAQDFEWLPSRVHRAGGTLHDSHAKIGREPAWRPKCHRARRPAFLHTIPDRSDM